MACECTIPEYIAMYPDYKAKIIAIDALIDKMLLSLMDQQTGASTGINEYQLDDGQIKVKTTYLSITQLANGINILEQIKNQYINRMQGRSVVLRDVSSFRRGR